MIHIQEHKDREGACTIHYGDYTDEFGTKLEFEVHETLSDEFQPLFLVVWETETPSDFDDVENKIVNSIW